MAELVDLLGDGIAEAEPAGRPDLRRRLENTRRRLLERDVRVVVVGEFKQGKSQLVNALVNAPACPVDDVLATSVPTVVRHGETPSATVLVPQDGDPFGDGAATAERRPVGLEEIGTYVSAKGNAGNRMRLLGAEVRVPRHLLADGLVIVDSPGVGGVHSAHELAALVALGSADAMLLVTDASQELTESELRFLRQGLQLTPHVACVVTKTDIYPHWREVAVADRDHLDRIDPAIPLFPVSAELRLHAARLQDSELHAESGYGPLVAYLRGEVVGKARRTRQRRAAQDLRSVIDQLRLSLRTELDALENPSGTPRRLAELEAARQRADELRRRSARWQTTLNDGVGDLIADLEHDLRDRLRHIQREAETAIDQGDPGPVWSDFSAWLQQRVAAAVSDTFVWTDGRAAWLAREVAEHFAADGVALPELRVGDTGSVLDPVAPVPDLDRGYVGFFQKVLIGMRGSYGGVLMFGLLTGLAGMPLINPISVGAGVLLGAKGYQEDRQARLKRRQGDAKTLVRRHIDDVVFQVGKQLKDRLRLVQRETRDHFTDIAEEHHRSLTDSSHAAQEAAATFAAERDGRIRQIRDRLGRLDALDARLAAADANPGDGPQGLGTEEAERGLQEQGLQEHGTQEHGGPERAGAGRA
ncbi:hypothetical protein NCCP1664_19500 [Zafaria cholistanensis]|uniref:Dynamin N-terminal domain-containing protein n=1 Tax=Zafaria cholistanensis TaxID=1682741 RepID=A0A5A7NRA3_9MICC|nr:dynamin family protein [Zafaria cholistanensis]GER23454.1 hypothetical protein NCCP1664_19500 [Zafaria cholistanensis]